MSCVLHLSSDPLETPRAGLIINMVTKRSSQVLGRPVAKGMQKMPGRNMCSRDAPSRKAAALPVATHMILFVSCVRAAGGVSFDGPTKYWPSDDYG